MANLTRLSVLIGEADPGRSRATVELLKELGVRHVMQVQAPGPLMAALETQAFDVLLCAERLGDADGVAVLRAARDVAPATRAVLMRANDRAGEYVPEDVTAIELPFSRLELQGLLHRTAAPHGGLWCEVPELSLTDILQMYHQTRRSITVLLSGPIAGRIWLEAGDIVHAQAGAEHGMAALSRLLEAESGLVRTQPYQGPVARTISVPFQSAILGAAQELDERRRDSMNSNPVAGRHAPGAPGPSSGSPSSPYLPVSPYPDERTSVSGALLRPAMTPPLAPPDRAPESLQVAARRRRRGQAIVAMLAALLVAGAIAAFLGTRLGNSRQQPAAETGDTASDPRPSNLEQGSRVEVTQAPAPESAAFPPAAFPSAAFPSAADAPAPSPPTAPSASHALAPVPSAPVPSDGAAHALGAARTPVPPRVAPAAPPEPAGFELYITSKPPRATVSEGNRVLGRTPLRLSISERSVAEGAREFVLRLPGYSPATISQAASGSDVSTNVVLSPRPVAVDNPDAGLYEPEFDSADPGGARSSNPRARRKDLGIRLRR